MNNNVNSFLYSVLGEGETTYQDICNRVGIDDPKIYTLSVPILKSGSYKKEKGSHQRSIYACAVLSPKDNCGSLIDTVNKCAILSANGAGISIYMGHIRPLGCKITNGKRSGGVSPYIRLFDQCVETFYQSSVRVGAGIAWLNIDHMDIYEFLLLGDVDKPEYKLQILKTGVVLTKEFMQCVKENKDITLKLPKEYVELHGSTPAPKTVRAKSLLDLVVRKRLSKGLCYIMFDDNVNDKRKTEIVECSNLCTEVLLPPHADNRLALCCLGTVSVVALYELGLSGAELENKITDVIKEVDEKLTYYRTVDVENTGIYKTGSLDIGVGFSGFCDVVNDIIIKWFLGSYDSGVDITEFRLMVPAIIYLIHNSEFFQCFKRSVKSYSELHKDVYKFVIAPNTISSRMLGNISSGIMPHRSKEIYSRIVHNKPEQVQCNVYKKYKDQISILPREHKVLLDTVLLYQENLIPSKYNVEFAVNSTDRTPRFTASCHILNHLLFEMVDVIDQGISFSLFSPKYSVDMENEIAKIPYYYKQGVKTLYYQTTLDNGNSDTCKLSNNTNCSSCEN